MANRATHEIQTPKDDVHSLTAQLKGAGAADMTLPEASFLGGGEVKSATRTGAGTFNLKFRFPYPQLLSIAEPGIVGTTAGLRGRFTAFDAAAQTATLVLEVGAVATDPAATDTVYLNWKVRNSGRNK